MRPKAIESCRICGNRELIPVLDLGEQALTGVFPRPGESVPRGPLRLVKCHGDQVCGLLQLQHSFDASAMYGDNYGYRSGLNASMVRHLQGKVQRLLARRALPAGSVVLDIGSNDGTTLAAYPSSGLRRVGIDPTAAKFRSFYPADVEVVTDFFSAANFRSVCADGRAAAITSFSMFYDLEDPLAFMREVAEVLADDGLWVFEQSYLPLMLERNSYDTVCHEHLEYYALAQIDWMARRAGLKIVDVEFNDVNGGSFSVTAAKSGSAHAESPAVASILAQERSVGLHELAAYAAFAERVSECRSALREFFAQARAAGKKVAALGASTKGNVLLQYCGVTRDDVFAVGDVNPDKFGRCTPGTGLPIASETEVLGMTPDFLLVLPWHFRETFLKKPLPRPSRLVFPLPRLEVV